MAAHLLHSVQLDREGLTAGSPRAYSERLSQAMKVAWPAELCLVHAQVRGEGITELRGLSWGVALWQHLIELFDEDWWNNPRTGGLLSKIFAQGQFEDAATLSARLGAGSPSLDRVARALEAQLM